MNLTQNKILTAINAFMNDNDRGPGHGIMQGAFYGLLFCIIGSFAPWYVVSGLCIINHIRAFYEEYFIEEWCHKPKAGDFWFDAFFRPLQTDIVSLLPYVERRFWPVVILAAFLAGWKRKNDWPAILFWKRQIS